MAAGRRQGGQRLGALRRESGDSAVGRSSPTVEQVATKIAGTMVDVRALKAAALRLKPDHPARAVILAEPDFLPVADYAAKAVVWFRLLDLGGD